MNVSRTNPDRVLFTQLRARVIEPTLGYLGLPGAEAAVRLLLGTAAQETGLQYLAQFPSGPALGIFQIEPATHDDIWENFLKFKPGLAAKVASFAALTPSRALQLASNLAYQTAIARVSYFRAPDPLPAPDDVDGLGRYWKRFHNTGAGGGTVAEFVQNFRYYIGD